MTGNPSSFRSRDLRGCLAKQFNSRKDKKHIASKGLRLDDQSQFAELKCVGGALNR